MPVMPNVVIVFCGKSSGSNCFVQNWLARENCDQASLKGISFFIALALRMEGIAEAIPAAARHMDDFFINALLDDFILQVLMNISIWQKLQNGKVRIKILFGKIYQIEFLK